MSYQRDSRNNSPKDETKLFANPLAGISDTPYSAKYQYDAAANGSDSRITYSDILSSGTPSVSGRSSVNQPFNPNPAPVNNPFSKQRSSETPSYSVTNYSTGSDIFKDLERALQKSKETRSTYTPTTGTQPMQMYKFTPQNQPAVPDIEDILRKSQDLRQLVEQSQKNPINIPPTTTNLSERIRPDISIDVNSAPANYQDYQKMENYVSPTNSNPSSTSSKSDNDGKVKKVMTKYHLNLQPIEETGESAILSPHDSKIFDDFTPKNIGDDEIKRSEGGSSPQDTMRKSDGFNKPLPFLPENQTPSYQDKTNPPLMLKSSSVGNLSNASNASNLRLSDYFSPSSATAKPIDLMNQYLSPQAINILTSPSIVNYNSGSSATSYEPITKNQKIEELINKYLNEPFKTGPMTKSLSNPNFFPTYNDNPVSGPVAPATNKVEMPDITSTDFFSKNKPVSYSSSLATSPEPNFLSQNPFVKAVGYVNQQAYVNPFATDSTIINPSYTIKPTPTPNLNQKPIETPSHKKENSSQFYSFDDGGSHVSFFSVASEIKNPNEFKNIRTDDQRNPYGDYDTLFDALELNKASLKQDAPTKSQAQPKTDSFPQTQNQFQPQNNYDDQILKYLDPPDDLRGLRTVKLKTRNSEPSDTGSNSKNRNLNQKYYTIQQTFHAEDLEDDYDSPTQSRPQTRTGSFPNELFDQNSLELESDYDSLMQSKRSAFEPPKKDAFDVIKEVPQAYESTPSKYGSVIENKTKPSEPQMSPIHGFDMFDSKGGFSMDRKTVSSDIFYDAEERMYSFEDDQQKSIKLPQLLNKLDENSVLATNRKSLNDKGRPSLGYNVNEKTIDIFDFENEKYFTVDEINPEMLESGYKKKEPETLSCMIWDIKSLNKPIPANDQSSKELSEVIANARKVKLIAHCFGKFSNLKLQFK